MYCPTCATEANDQTKYCTRCGTNLRRIKGVMGKGGAGMAEQADWQRATLEDWKAERKRRREKSPEEKRIDEIKAGVITSSAGLGGMIFLYFLFNGIANNAPGVAQDILRAIPMAGLIPFLVGIGMIINGYFVSRRLVELKQQETERERQAWGQPGRSITPDTSPVPRLVESAQPPIPERSVTESTTAQLRSPVPVALRQEDQP